MSLEYEPSSEPLHISEGALIPVSLGLSDYSQVDRLGLRYKLVNFGAEMSPGSPNW